MDHFTFAKSPFIMNGTTASARRASLRRSSLIDDNEQELYPLRQCKNIADDDIVRNNNYRCGSDKENDNCQNERMTSGNNNGERLTPSTIDTVRAIDDNEEDIEGFVWNEHDSSATFVGQNAWHIPSSLTFRYASRIRRLDLSFNCLQTLSGIEYFNALEELVLDNNLLDDSIRFFYNPMMRILSINKNKITDLERFLNEISLKLPGLTYLSLLGNAACPDQLSSSDHDEQDYRRYRSYVIHRIPLLRFLDSTAIRKQEREEALQRGHYYRLIRLNSDSFIEKQRSARPPEEEFRQQAASVSGNNKRQLTPLPFGDENSPKGGYGRLRHRYTGKHSEGNRFIRNHEL